MTLPLSRRSLIASLLAISAVPLAACSKKTKQDVLAQGTDDSSMHEVIVIGAGIAGLSAAYLLRDLDVVVVESQAQPGGRVSDGSYAGISFPKGTRTIAKPDGPLLTIVSELGLNPLELASPFSSCVSDLGSRTILSGMAGVIQRLSTPEDPSAIHRFLKALRELSSQYESVDQFDAASPLAVLDHKSAREWFVQNQLPSVYQEHFNAVARSRFGASIDDISALGLLPEMSLDFDSIKDDALSEFRDDPRSSSFTFQNGLSEVTGALAKALAHRMRFGLQVQEIRAITDGGFEVIVIRDAGRFSLRARTVLVATPAPVAAKIAENVLSDEQRMILAQVRYAQCATVSILSNTPIWDKSFELLMPTGSFFPSLYNASWTQSVRNFSNKGLLVAHLAQRSLDDSLLNMTDSELTDRVKKQLEKIYPDCSGSISHTGVSRFPNAYPVMTPGSHARLKRLHETLSGHVQLAGDYLIFPTFESAIDSARLASNRIRSALQFR